VLKEETEVKLTLKCRDMYEKELPDEEVDLGVVRSEVLMSLRMAGQVVRYHTWPMLRRETVAEHTWSVMRIYAQLFGVPDTPHVLMHILYHDVGEVQVGDIPFPVKRNNPDLKREMDRLEDDALSKMGVEYFILSPLEAWRVKVCDIMDMLEAGVQEMMMGNRYAQPIVDDTYGALVSMLADPESAAGVGDSTTVRAYMARVREPLR
jgi:hypothetical protein